MLRLFPLPILAFLFVITFTSCDKSSNTVAHIDKQEFSLEDRKMLGTHLAESIITDAENYDVLNANAYSDVYDYLKGIFDAAVLTEQVLTRGDFDWDIIPLQDDDAFAYALPGGKIVISTGFLKFIESESELMALLAHEIYYTDQDLITGELKDEFGGVVLGDVLLGNEITMLPLIDFLKKNSFSETDVLGADMHVLDLLCPFNYDIYSLNSLVSRANDQRDNVSWIERRPRADTEWTNMMDERSATCDSAQGQRFESRYRAFKTMLPE